EQCVAVGVIRQRRALVQNAVARGGGGGPFHLAVFFERAEVASHLEENALELVLLQDSEDLVGVARVRPVVEGEQQSLGGKFRAHDFIGVFLFFYGAAGVGRGQSGFVFLEDLLALVLLLHVGQVAPPGFA